MPYPTEEEMQLQRVRIRAAWPLLFEALEEQLWWVDANLGSNEKGFHGKYDLALSALLAQATKISMGIVLLCENGFGELAVGAVRPLGEAMASAYYMSLDPDARAEQFEAFGKLERLGSFELFESHGVGDLLERTDDLRDPEWIAAVRAEFPRPAQGWTQVPMNRVMADIEPCWTEEGQRQLRRIGGLLHLYGDRHPHVGSLHTLDTLSADGDRLLIHLGPKRGLVPFALQIAAWVYGQVFDLWAQHFQIPDLESWQRRWRLLLARATPLDPSLTRDTGRNDPCPCGSGFKFKRCHADVVAAPPA